MQALCVLCVLSAPLVLYALQVLDVLHRLYVLSMYVQIHSNFIVGCSRVSLWSGLHVQLFFDMSLWVTVRFGIEID